MRFFLDFEELADGEAERAGEDDPREGLHRVVEREHGVVVDLTAVCSCRKFSSAWSSGYASATAKRRPSAAPRIPSACAASAGLPACCALARACVTASNVSRSWAA